MNPDHTRDSNKTVKTTDGTSDYKYKARGWEETVLYIILLNTWSDTVATQDDKSAALRAYSRSVAQCLAESCQPVITLSSWLFTADQNTVFPRPLSELHSRLGFLQGKCTFDKVSCLGPCSLHLIAMYTFKPHSSQSHITSQHIQQWEHLPSDHSVRPNKAVLKWWCSIQLLAKKTLG